LTSTPPTNARAQTRRLSIKQVGKGWPRATLSFFRQLLVGMVRLRAIFIACALVLGEQTPAFSQTSQRVLESLTERGLGGDVLGIISNTVFDAGQEPPRGTERAFLRQIASPRHLLDDPIQRFERALAEMGWPVRLDDQERRSGAPPSIGEATARFVRRSRAAVADWRIAIAAFQQTGGHDRASLSDALGAGEIVHEAVTDGLDAELGANAALLGRSMLRLLNDLMAARPLQPVRPTKDVSILVGSVGPDVYRPEAPHEVTLIVDPGGDDRYDFSALAPGAVLIVVDHAGADSYVGGGGILSLLVVVDHAGNDRWGDEGPGPAAAFGGVAAIADLQGDDLYNASFFGQAAAILGRAVLFDANGHDRYQLHGLGQGFAATAGAAVLLDGDGDDHYSADGAVDVFNRGGRVSKAQGVGFGSRQGVAGGFGALVDLAGDDIYEAEMFAQGHGFFFGIGLLADRAGNDRYDAVRYAQGAAAHVGIGLLVDETGDDAYASRVGISQGMGLDRSIGLLRDGAGDDMYRGGSLAQGASTANGLGILADTGGTDLFSLEGNGWGEGHWAGGMPGAGFLLGVDHRDNYVLAGAPQDIEIIPLGGPHAMRPVRRESASDPACIASDEDNVALSQSLTAALAQAYPLAGDGEDARRAHRFVRRMLTRDFDATITAVGENEQRGLGLLGVLRCVVSDQGATEADAIIRDLVGSLDRGSVALGWMYAGALVALEQPPLMVRAAILGLAAQSDCTALVGSIELARRSLRADVSATPLWILPVVRQGQRSRCWRAQAAALRFSDSQTDIRLGHGSRPSFLRNDDTRRQAFSTP
jgi:hypothetical protein